MVLTKESRLKATRLLLTWKTPVVIMLLIVRGVLLNRSILMLVRLHQPLVVVLCN